MRKHKASNYEFSAMLATYAVAMLVVAMMYMFLICIMELICWNLW